MGKLIVVDDEGKQEEFNHFLAVAINEEGEMVDFVEDEGLDPESKLGLLISGLRLLAVMAAEIVEVEP